MAKFTHLDDEGNAVMVDVSDKQATQRTATAKGTVTMEPETMALIQAGGVKKGDVLSVAHLAGIMGAKRTPDLIPLCHPLELTSVTVDLVCDPGRRRYYRHVQAQGPNRGRDGSPDRGRGGGADGL